MSKSFVLDHIGQLATCGDGGLELTPDAAVWIEGKTIQWAGPRAQLPKEAPDAAIDAEERLVTSGLIDAHTHCVFAGDRLDEFEWRCQGQSYQDIASKGGGIRSTMRATRASTEHELVFEALMNVAKGLECGTTAMEIKSGYGLTLDDEFRMLRAAQEAWRALDLPPDNLSLTFLGAHAVPPEFEGDPEGYVQYLTTEALPRLPEAVRSVDAFVEEGYFNQGLIEPYLREAKALGFELRLHVDQLRDSGGASFAARMGARSADHLEYTSAAGIRECAEAGVFPVLLPGSVLGLGHSRYPDARAMLAAGMLVVLATDFNPGSSPVRSLPSVMNLACRMMRMTPAEALAGCTTHAAASLGWGDRLGRVAPGFQADLVLWNADDYRELAYWTPPPAPSMLFVAGEELLATDE